MSKLDCPLDNFTTESAYTPTAAKELADHLIEMHCRAPLPIDPNLIDVVDGPEGEVRVKAGPAKAEVEAKHR